MLSLMEELFDLTPVLVIFNEYLSASCRKKLIFIPNQYFHPTIDHTDWIYKYNSDVFFQLFRLKKDTFERLVRIVLEHDKYDLIKKKYRGGNYPYIPERSVLMFLWYMAHNDPLVVIADRFGSVASTVMQIVNACLYIVNKLKHIYIRWPENDDERNSIEDGFTSFPGNHNIFVYQQQFLAISIIMQICRCSWGH